MKKTKHSVLGQDPLQEGLRYYLFKSRQAIFWVTSRNLFLLVFLGLSQLLTAQISGIVYRDYNANGVRNTGASYNEEGVANVTVKAYNAAGVEVGSTVSSSTGAYSFSGLTLPVRLEFEPTLVDDYSGAFGTGNGTSVQFHSASTTTANFGVNYPEHYCHTTNPNIITTCFVNGRPATGTPQTDVLVRHPYNATGTTSSNTYLGDAGQLGSIWGIAYNRESGDIYTSSLVKRHTGMKDNDSDGKEDIGAIYVRNSAGVVSLWLDLATLPGVDVGLSLMPTIATRGLPNSNMGPSYDGNVFTQVGKIGLGDLEISDDNTKLYVISLFDKKLYTIDIATKTLVGAGIAIPNECTGGQVRPFSLTHHRGKIYVGTICDAITSQLDADLEANVYRLDGGTFTNILSFPLNYVKGAAFTDWDGDPSGNTSYGLKWNPWEDNFDAQKAFLTSTGAWAMIHPQPMLANIEFDHDESMILVFNDRNGHQMGTANYGISAGTHGTTLHTSVAAGDILRASTATGSYVLEVNATSGSTTTMGAGNNQGPATINGMMNGYTGTGGEYYWGDQALIFGSTVYHKDAVMGGSTYLAGAGETYVHIVDAYEAWGGGSYWMDNTTGNFSQSYGIYPATVSEVLFGKANGLGDPEVMCNTAPLEIGNRVWADTDNDGVQDPGESGISGLLVELWKESTPGNFTQVATVTTNTNGSYYFSNASGTSVTGITYDPDLQPNMSYQLRFPLTSGALSLSGQMNMGNAGGNPVANADLRDSDASPAGIIAFSTTVSGANNHTYDVAYAACTPPSAITTSQVPPTCTGATANNNGTISLTGATNGTHYGVSTLNAGSYDGPAFASATAIPALPAVIQTTVPNIGGTYIVRIFNGDNACFTDVTVTVAAVTCTATCTQPSAISFSQAPATCTGTTANNNGTASLVAVSNGTHFGVSTLNAVTYDGPAFAMASALPGTLPTVVKTAIPNTGGTYIVRIFNGDAACFTDQTVTAATVNCSCSPLPCGTTTAVKN